MAVASLLMYDRPEPVARANDALWAGVAARLGKRGLEAPAALDRAAAYDSYWLRDDLLLAQACGFPYVKKLAGHVRLVATPVYRWPGGDGARRASFIIVREDDKAKDLAAMRGRRAAVNDHLSNSGMNLFRRAVAPLAEGRTFFSTVIVTGGHAASIDAVRDGTADIAAIDSVTWGLFAAHAPERLAGLRILSETALGPGLPLITAPKTGDADLTTIRAALADAIADPTLADAVDVLGLTGLETLNDQAYAELARLESEALALGYPALA